jgi:pyridoxine 5-phosphate synthase
MEGIKKMRLGVNIDHIATVREARKTVEPDPVAGAVLADLGGADGIVVHLREDRRHIQDRDLQVLRKVVTSNLNLEMAATDSMVEVALTVRPELVTLVPETREEVTTEGGLDVVGQKGRLAEVVDRLKEGGLGVSLFIDPEIPQVEASGAVGAQVIEIHTGHYANSKNNVSREQELARIIKAAKAGRHIGLEVSAGHGLTYHNVGPVAAVPEIEELNIGHSIISRAVLTGIQEAVSEMAAVIRRARKSGAGR